MAGHTKWTLPYPQPRSHSEHEPEKVHCPLAPPVGYLETWGITAQLQVLSQISYNMKLYNFLHDQRFHFQSVIQHDTVLLPVQQHGNKPTN